MGVVTRRIGLSLGADLCWPLCYEGLLKRLKLAIPHQGDTVQLEVERVPIEPFDLSAPLGYDVVIDRLTHWYHTRREWIKKGVLMDDLYVFNNPWTVQSMEKQTSYCAMMELGLPVPKTWMVPPREYDDSSPDLQPTLDAYARLFDLNKIGEELGYPLFIKPYDGGGWVGVTRIESAEALAAAYEQSGKRVMHLQQAVDPHEKFVRCVGLGPQIRFVSYDPSAPLHQRYLVETDVTEEDKQLLSDTTMTINSFFGWDFNSCEALLKEGVWHPIDFANPCPDSQVTSLHYHFPWLIKANIRWSVFCAVTNKAFRRNLDWAPYYEAAKVERPLKERLRAYAKIAHERMETDRFHEFCDKHLAHLDEVALEFFGTEEAKAAVRKKVQALFPAHEHDEFTDYFWDKIQQWRKDAGGGAKEKVQAS